MTDLDQLDPKVKLEMAKRVLARRSLISFTQRFMPNYQPGWLHHDIARRLEQFKKDVEDQKSPRLMLLVPPRHGKSELTSIRFNGWCLGHHPEWEMINCGYNLDLPMKFSRKVREMVRDPGFKPVFPSCQIDPDSQSAEAWNTTSGGGFTAAGVGGGITGKGAHILTIDDPIKNQVEADSITTRDTLWDWYWSTAYSRLAPGGGVLLIQCMTGETPVLMANGAYKRIDEVVAGERVATWDDGELTTEVVTASRSSGYDEVYAIKMTSGIIVRANARHPFLVEHDNGEVEWIQLQHLQSGQRIVTVRGSGESIAEKLAARTTASSQPSAEGSAPSTTTSGAGLKGIARRLRTAVRSAQRILNTATRRLSESMTACWSSRSTAARSASNTKTTFSLPRAGSRNSASITATTPALSEDCSVTTATSSSSGAKPLPTHSSEQRTMSDFTTSVIESITPDGYEEVFDLTVNRTHNFIAVMLTVHNTWWHDDDLAGRLQQKMENDDESDKFVVIKYPARADKWEYHNKETDLIERLDAPLAPEHEPMRQAQRALSISEPVTIDETHTLLRMPGEALHPERYNEKMINSLAANQPPRIWSALYQQNPVPDEGVYFRQEYFKFEPTPPANYERNVFQAWDFAIGEKQQNDYTVGVTVIQDENDFLHMVELVRFKGDSFTIVEEMLDAAERWGSEPSAPLTLGVEDSQIWKAIKPLFEKRMAERRQYLSYEVLRPLTDKMARARPLQGRMQQGRVYFPANAAWLPEVQKELLRFPAGAHDDIVDAMAWVAHLTLGRSPRAKRKRQKPTSWKDKLSLYTGAGSGGHMSA